MSFANPIGVVVILVIIGYKYEVIQSVIFEKTIQIKRAKVNFQRLLLYVGGYQSLFIVSFGIFWTVVLLDLLIWLSFSIYAVLSSAFLRFSYISLLVCKVAT